MERFTIEKSPDKILHWVCTDHESGLICTFEDRKFFCKTVFTSPSGIKHPDYFTFNKLETEIANWLIKNHIDKIY